MVRFRLSRGISETNSRFFQIFLATGRLFAENLARILAYGKPFFGNLARILGRVKGLPRPVGGGGGSVFVLLSSSLGCGGASVLPSCGACFRPCLRPVHLQKIGLPWGLNWVLCVRPFGRSRGAFIISLACVPCQVGNKGRKFSYLLPVLSCPQKKTITDETLAII